MKKEKKRFEPKKVEEVKVVKEAPPQPPNVLQRWRDRREARRNTK